MDQPQDVFVSTGQTAASEPPPMAPPPVQPMVTPPSSKKSFSRIFIWILVGVLVLAALAFAGFKFFGSKSTASGEITWWGLWEDASTVQPLITAYESSHQNVKITYVKQSPQDYRERLTSSLAKGSGPDIFTFHNTWVPMFKNDLDTLPASVMNPADFAKTFYPIASSDLTSGTGIVGIPLMYDALTLFINEDIFNGAGKVPPATWDDLRVLARELTIKNDQGVITQSGVALGRTENVDHWPEILGLMMLQNGVDLANPVGTPAEDALTFFTIFSAVDGVWDATLPSSTQVFAAGKLAMYIGPSWRAFEIIQQNPNLKFKTVPIPQLPKDNPKQEDVTYATYWVQGVWARSTKKASAWEFLKFLSTQDSLQKLYQNESKVRNFGEPYPRVDMANLLKDHPIVGSIINQVPGAQSWFLSSRTFDGPTGINSQMASYFGDAVNAVADGTTTAERALETAAQGVQQILSQYRLIAN
jgi:ABC-type glycerol-3-phosphate transport system substrate-binding protein